MAKKGLAILIMILISITGIFYVAYRNSTSIEEKSSEQVSVKEDNKKILEEFNEVKTRVIEKAEKKPEKIEIEDKKAVITKIAKEKGNENKSIIIKKIVEKPIKKQEIKQKEFEDKKTEDQVEFEIIEKEKIIEVEKLAKIPVKTTIELENEKFIVKEKIEIKEAEEVDQAQLIGIMIELDNYSVAEEMLGEMSDKDSYDYYFLSAKLAEGQGETKEALELYEKAYEKDETNPIPRLRILRVYIRNKKYRRRIKRELKLISELEMTESERKEFEVLKKLLNKDERFKHLFRISTGVTVTDNVESDYENEQSDFKSTLSLTYLNLFKINDKYSLTSFASYYNEMYAETNEKSSHSIFVGTELNRTFDKWKISVPLMLSYSMVDNEEAVRSTSLGLEATKLVNDSLSTSFGVNVEPMVNTLYDFDGNEYFSFANLEWQKDKSTNYKFEITAEQASYSEESENYNGYGAEISRQKLYKEKYDLELKYNVIFENYTEDNRDDLVHLFDISLKSNLFNTKWEYILAYGLEIADSNYTEYEYQKNELSIKLRRDF